MLDTLGVEMDVDLYTQTPKAAAGEIGRLGLWSGTTAVAITAGTDRPGTPAIPGGPAADAGLLLASWRMSLDGGALQDGEPYLAGTARADVAWLSGGTAPTGSGSSDGDVVTISGPDGSLRLPMRSRPAWSTTSSGCRRGSTAGPPRNGSGPVSGRGSASPA